MTRLSRQHGWMAALAAGVALAITTQAFGQELFRYSYVDIGTLGGPFSRAVAMNDHGVVTGWADRSDREGDYHAFVWRQGPPVDIGTLGGWSVGRGINNAGDVVGVSLTDKGQPHGFIYTDGVMYDLNDLIWFPLAAPGSGNECTAPLQVILEANAINDAGVIAACGLAWSDEQPHGYLLHPAAGLGPARSPIGYYYVDLGRLERAPDCLALDVNGFDEVVGISGGHAFRWDRGRIDRLETVSDASRANAINEKGDATGWSLEQGLRRAALWAGGGRALLDTPAGWESKAFDISDNGAVVGWRYNQSAPLALPPAATLWEGERVTDLNEVTAIPLLPDLTQWVHLESAVAIDESGRIAGYGRLSSGYERAFILLPIPLD